MTLIGSGKPNQHLPELARNARDEFTSQKEGHRRKRLLGLGGVLLGGILIGAFVMSIVLTAFTSEEIAVSEEMRGTLTMIEEASKTSLSKMSPRELQSRLEISPLALALAARLDALPDRQTFWSYLPEWTGLYAPSTMGRETALEMLLRQFANMPDTELGTIIAWLETLIKQGHRTEALLSWYSSLNEPTRDQVDRQLVTGGLDTEYLEIRNFALSMPTEYRDLFLGQDNGAVSYGTDLIRLMSYNPRRLQRLLDIERAYAGPYRGQNSAPFPCLQEPTQTSASDGRWICNIIVSAN